MNLDVNKAIYSWTKEVNFTIYQWNSGYTIMTEIYSTHNEAKFLADERCIRKYKKKSYKYMTSISKNMDIDKFDDII